VAGRVKTTGRRLRRNLPQEKKLDKSKQRISELDSLFKRLYEYHVGRRLSDERFEKLSADYEAEQKQLTEHVAVLEAEFAEKGGKAANVGKFLAIDRKYTATDHFCLRFY